ncbi:hypothetical protein [Streptomyces sp. NPDC048606]|uniref:hypothetical protein n=1 Tax=Streptomyces sp. NPDC048606 TaxID=3154726 RepID=UPI003432E2A5
MGGMQDKRQEPGKGREEQAQDLTTRPGQTQEHRGGGRRTDRDRHPEPTPHREERHERGGRGKEG